MKTEEDRKEEGEAEGSGFLSDVRVEKEFPLEQSSINLEGEEESKEESYLKERVKQLETELAQ